ncbi:MAG: ribosomal L7Ae/L30e/S12e/Gadd45 family protein [Ruminococcus sp.]|nr:ribosomal L7Ae/L30e/S12e/Gadd45 family protein [Ruminococcus sp.]
MNSKKTANLLTICLKAGKTVKGFDSVCDALKNGSVFCVLTASDASEKTVKEISFVCGKHSVPLFRTELTKEEMGILCGKITAVIAVCDKGFADGFSKIVSA